MFFFDRIVLLPGCSVENHPVLLPILHCGNRNLQYSCRLHTVCEIGEDSGTETDTKDVLLPLSYFYGDSVHCFSDFDSVPYIFLHDKLHTCLSGFAIPLPPQCAHWGTFPPGEGFIYPSACSTSYTSGRCRRGRDRWGLLSYPYCGQAAALPGHYWQLPFRFP